MIVISLRSLAGPVLRSRGASEGGCDIPGTVGRAAQSPILSCTGLGFPCRRRCRRARWALTPPFHPHPSPRRFRGWLGAVCFLWHFPSRRLEPPCPGLSRSDSGRRPCGQPRRRDSVSRRESCPMVSGLSSPNRSRIPADPEPAGALGAGLPAPSGCFQRTERRPGPKTKEFDDGAGNRKTQEHLSRCSRRWPTAGWPSRFRCHFRTRNGRTARHAAKPPNKRSGRIGRTSQPCPPCGSHCRY